jgi:hypothetical protein
LQFEGGGEMAVATALVVFRPASQKARAATEGEAKARMRRMEERMSNSYCPVLYCTICKPATQQVR